MGKSAAPLLTEMSALQAVPSPREPGQGKALHLDLDYEREDFFTPVREVGEGPFMPRLSFTEAVRQFIV
jgi:hypothetical protein